MVATVNNLLSSEDLEILVRFLKYVERHDYLMNMFDRYAAVFPRIKTALKQNPSLDPIRKSEQQLVVALIDIKSEYRPLFVRVFGRDINDLYANLTGRRRERAIA